MTEADYAARSEGELEDQLHSSIGELLGALRAVAEGDLSRALPVRYPDTHPVGALASSINSMIEALRDARKQSDDYMHELAEQIQTIERQAIALQELSTPIIEVWPGVLCIPIIGALDSGRATEMTRALLTAVVEKKTPHVILDMTGIDSMDTRAADHFIRMARAVRLLGARCVVSGVHPNIARAIVDLGVNLLDLQTYRATRDALRDHVRKSATRIDGTL
jgi:rsbT co-antagonist protein RsbR